MQWHYNNDENAYYVAGITGQLRVTYTIEVWAWEVSVCGEIVAEGSAPTMMAAQAAAIAADRQYTRDIREGRTAWR